jgi:hypothetical protein
MSARVVCVERENVLKTFFGALKSLVSFGGAAFLKINVRQILSDIAKLRKHRQIIRIPDQQCLCIFSQIP